ncbi:NAD(P)-dependent oxidoreductase [Frankia sp. Cppng1_Ct_nod]|uniref:NAD(P)-dependent oxidoreductase n=1 Tax=Frankia sp. Cppng1_Ct_nod TaxID=2897162 RepID=UPI001A93DDAC|nr:NAD(P)-dependent oxidoreductase [Frankia sp. Cppng1_Ct_nod]
MTDPSAPGDTTPDTTVGFIGLGKMGLPMAVNLARRGFDVLAWNRGQAASRAAAAAGLELAADPAAVGTAARTVITMLPDLPQVRQVLDGPRGLLAPGSAVDALVVMGTVSPVAVRDLANRLAERGVVVVDAPVSGGEKGAQDASLSIMIGGAEEACTRLLPYFEAMGRAIRRMGPVGSGSLAKACNQLVVAATITALAEALLLAERGGLDTETLLDILGNGLARSEVLSQKRQHFISGDFHGTGPAGYLVKDLGFVLASAGAEHVTLPVADAVAQLYADVVEQGLVDFDNSIVLEVLRRRFPRAA